MSTAELFAKRHDEGFSARFQDECDKSNGQFVTLRFSLSRTNINSLNSLGWGVLCVTPENVNYIWPTLYHIGVVFEEECLNLIELGSYFYVAYPCKYYIFRANRAARHIQKTWKKKQGLLVVSSIINDLINEEISFARSDEEKYSSGFESETTQSSDSESKDAMDIDEEMNTMPYISKCHSDTMRCGHCWKNLKEGTDEKCWYKNVEEHTDEQKLAYRKYLALDTRYLTSLKDDVRDEREAAYRKFITLIGGNGPERLAAIRIVDTVFEEFYEEEDSENVDENVAGENVADEAGTASWVNSIFRTAGFS